MVGDVRNSWRKQPFTPFTIVSSAGQKFHVPTADHVSINPRQTRVIVYLDDDSHVAISPLHIVALEEAASSS
jgi:hypothetical protein